MSQQISSSSVQKRGSATTVKACDLCRKRKRRCVWMSGSQGCTPCTNLKETCLTTYVRKERSKPHKANRITEYESRIKTLESLLQDRNAAQPHIDRQPLSNNIQSAIPASTWVSNLRDEVETMPHPPIPNIDPFELDTFLASNPPSFDTELNMVSVEDYNADMIISQMTLPMGIGGIAPSIDKQVDNTLLQSMDPESDANSVAGTNLRLKTNEDCDDDWPPPLPRQCGCDWYLPPPQVGTSLLAEYLTDFNTALPLYQPHAIAEHLRVCYAGESDGSSVSWTSAYVVFGLAHMLRAMSTTGSTHDNDMARYYLSRIYHALNGLLTAPPSQGLVQCLLGVATLITSTACRYSLSEGHFVSTALRVMQGLAYQDEGIVTANFSRDAEQERRVFWLAFIYDTGQSIITNSPTTHRHEDVIGCQTEFLSDGQGVVTAAEGHWQVDIFSLRVKLANLQAEVIDQVISTTRKLNASTLDTEAAAAMVLARLDRFHNHEVFQLGLDRLFELLYRSDICHVVDLEAAFFSTVYRVHALLGLGMNPKINPFGLEGLRKVAGLTEHRSYGHAKRLLSLLPIAPRGDVGLYWRLHQAFFAALVTIFAHHINNPGLPKPQASEVRAYGQTLVDLRAMNQSNPLPELSQTRDFCASLYLRLQTDLRN